MEVIAGCEQLNTSFYANHDCYACPEEIWAVISDSMLQTGAGLGPMLS
jgi:hypothetical protein